MRVLIAIALLLGTANASKIAEVKDACGGTHFVNPDTPETSKEKSEREKWMGRVHFSRIVFEGVRLSPAELNQITGELRKRKTIGLEGLSEGLEQVRDEFQQRGFFQVQVTPVFKVISGTKCYHNASARFRVNTGRRYRLKEITFSNARNSSVDELREAFPLETGDIFNTAKVRIGLEGLRKAYIKRGYIDFMAVPDAKIDEDESTISLSVDIFEGKVFHVRQIGVAGLTDQRFQQFYAQFPLKEGAVYDAEALERFFDKHREFAPKNFRVNQDVEVKANQEEYTVDLRIDLSGYHIKWPDMN